MYLIFVMMGILLFASLSRTVVGVSHIWVVETAQFVLAAYYLLGGAYSLQLDSHVRMDLLYGTWSPRGRALADVATGLFLVFYLVFLLLGGISSTEYALEYDQRNYSSWAPRLAPIKLIMCFGIVLMLLQVISIFFKDLARALGRPIENEPHAASESAPETRRGAA
jgi:TRAP-type mannitol/chloroaromatic compound transport system permease small subunit